MEAELHPDLQRVTSWNIAGYAYIDTDENGYPTILIQECDGDGEWFVPDYVVSAKLTVGPRFDLVFYNYKKSDPPVEKSYIYRKPVSA